MELPPFPEPPTDRNGFTPPPVLPIPRLLPDWEALQSLIEMHERRQQTVGWVPVATGAAAGAAAAVAVLLAIGAICQRRKSLFKSLFGAVAARGRPAMRWPRKESPPALQSAPCSS